MSDYKKNSEVMAGCLGGRGNIAAVTNCMTRLRVTVRDECAVNEDSLKACDDVLQLVHDRSCYYEIVVGPGKSRKYADMFHELGYGAEEDDDLGLDSDSSSSKASPADNDGQAAAGSSNADDNGNAAAAGSKAGKNAAGSSPMNHVKAFLKTLGDIFVPLIPGIIAAGLCAGFAALIAQLVPDYADIKVWSIIYNVLTLINTSFMMYLTAWAGYRAAERFGATPILGGMLGMITTLPEIAEIAKTLGLYDEKVPLNSILNTGKGGVLAVIAGVFLLSIVEKKIRSKMPESIDVVLTPLITMIVCAVPYILIIMPALGFVSQGIVWVVSKLCLSDSIIIRIIAGYVSAAMFLPLVAAGMHHGLVALYSVQLQEIGYITLYPALAMAGAGQVGATIAIWLKAKKIGDKKLCSVISGALPAGFLGVGEPLIYGVTLPLGKPFITAGLGAGFGGAIVMAAEVASTTWGPSGILGIFVMTNGPNGAVKSVMYYVLGLLVSYVCAFIITNATYSTSELAHAREDHLQTGTADRGQVQVGAPEQNVASANRGQVQVGASEQNPDDKFGSYPEVHHGDPITIGSPLNSFEYTIKDPVGIHARPAGKMSQIVKQYDCEVTVSANGKTASAGSVIDMMNMGAVQGTVLKVSAEGKDAGAAIKAVKEFLEQNM